MLRFTALLITFLCVQTGLFAQTSLQFDGVNDYVNCGNDPSLNITGTAITLEAWIYPTSFTTEVWRGNIINKNGSGENGYMIRVGNGGQVNFNIGSTGWNELNTATGVVTLNTWHHVAGVYDGTEMRIYVNGTLQASAPETVNIGVTTLNLLLGEDPQWTGRYFPGRIDEARVWNVARTEAEIQAGMNSEICTLDPSLVLYYRFNDGVAGANNTGITTLTDESGNGSNGTLMNFALNGATSNWATGVTLTQGISSTVIQQDACNSYYWAESGQTYTQSGFYTHTLTSSQGCDSVLTLDLSIYAPNNVTTNATECGSYTWGVTGQTYTNGGVYDTVLYTSQGCPYTHTLNLTLNQGYDTTYTSPTCGPYTWPVNGQTYTVNGMYTETYTAVNGCDSTINLNVFFYPQLTSVITQNQNGNLEATNGTSFQWLDCNNGMAPISGATSSTYTPTLNGSYAVISEDWGSACPDTSDCYVVDYVGLKGLDLTPLTVYPNPTQNGTIHIEFNDVQVAVLHVRTVDGKLVETIFEPKQSLTVTLPEAAGMYLLQAETVDGIAHCIRVERQ